VLKSGRKVATSGPNVVRDRRQARLPYQKEKNGEKYNIISDKGKVQSFREDKSSLDQWGEKGSSGKVLSSTVRKGGEKKRRGRLFSFTDLKVCWGGFHFLKVPVPPPYRDDRGHQRENDSRKGVPPSKKREG